MKRIVCDICKERNADIHFKVKQLKAVYSGDVSNRRWVRIDVCPVCYDKLFRITKDKNNVCPHYVKLVYDDNTPPKYVCYGTREMEECSCGGNKGNCTFTN